MILYSTIITISVIGIILGNIIFGLADAGTVVLGVLFNLLLVVGIDAVVALIVHSVPERKINPFAKYFVTGKTERKVYNFLRVKKWKDIIPESGKYLAHFAKDKVERPHDNKYVLKFLRETCYAEIMHEISFFLGFIGVFFMPYSLSVVIPIAAVNGLLQLMPILVQRYNRIRLIILYKYNEQHNVSEDNDVESEAACGSVG